VSSLVADASTILFDSPLKSTQLGGYIEASVIERREFALNGDKERWMGVFFSGLFYGTVILWHGHGLVAVCNVI